MNRKELRAEYPVEAARPVDSGVKSRDVCGILEGEEIRGLRRRSLISEIAEQGLIKAEVLRDASCANLYCTMTPSLCRAMTRCLPANAGRGSSEYLARADSHHGQERRQISCFCRQMANVGLSLTDNEF